MGDPNKVFFAIAAMIMVVCAFTNGYVHQLLAERAIRVLIVIFAVAIGLVFCAKLGSLFPKRELDKSRRRTRAVD